MIIHKLIATHLRGSAPDGNETGSFYRLQADDAVQWIRAQGVDIGPGTRALDLGCGTGLFGEELQRAGCDVTFADYANNLAPELAGVPFLRIDLSRESPGKLGAYDLLVCSNVLEHLPDPHALIARLHEAVLPGGYAYLSWTNWLSPWGGHEFSPFHYLGPARGHLVYDRLRKRPRYHTPYRNLFPTSIGGMLNAVRRNKHLRLVRAVPRYYNELGFLVSVPVAREFLTWNCALLLERVA